MWEIVIICALFGIFILASFITGLYYGSKIKNNETIEIPRIKFPQKNHNSMDIELTKSQQIEWDNINNYDGTEASQKEIE